MGCTSSKVTEVSGPCDSLVYTTILYSIDKQYAPFHPSQQVELGDYGNIDDETGQFIPRGNVLNEYQDLNAMVGEPTRTPQGHRHIFASQNKGSRGVVQELNVNAHATVGKCICRGAWAYTGGRHAAIFLIDPVTVRLRYEAQMGDYLAGKNAAKFSQYAIVTELTECSSYASLLTTGEAGKAYVGFDNKVPAGKNAWRTEVTGAVCYTGLCDPEKQRYVPLCTLRTIGESKAPVTKMTISRSGDSQPLPLAGDPSTVSQHSSHSGHKKGKEAVREQKLVPNGVLMFPDRSESPLDMQAGATNPPPNAIGRPLGRAAESVLPNRHQDPIEGGPHPYNQTSAKSAEARLGRHDSILDEKVHPSLKPDIVRDQPRKAGQAAASIDLIDLGGQWQGAYTSHPRDAGPSQSSRPNHQRRGNDSLDWSALGQSRPNGAPDYHSTVPTLAPGIQRQGTNSGSNALVSNREAMSSGMRDRSDPLALTSQAVLKQQHASVAHPNDSTQSWQGNGVGLSAIKRSESLSKTKRAENENARRNSYDPIGHSYPTYPPASTAPSNQNANSNNMNYPPGNINTHQANNAGDGYGKVNRHTNGGNSTRRQDQSGQRQHHGNQSSQQYNPEAAQHFSGAGMTTGIVNSSVAQKVPIHLPTSFVSPPGKVAMVPLNSSHRSSRRGSTDELRFTNATQTTPQTGYIGDSGRGDKRATGSQPQQVDQQNHVDHNKLSNSSPTFSSDTSTYPQAPAVVFDSGIAPVNDEIILMQRSSRTIPSSRPQLAEPGQARQQHSGLAAVSGRTFGQPDVHPTTEGNYDPLHSGPRRSYDRQQGSSNVAQSNLRKDSSRVPTGNGTHVQATPYGANTVKPPIQSSQSDRQRQEFRPRVQQKSASDTVLLAPLPA